MVSHVGESFCQTGSFAQLSALVSRRSKLFRRDLLPLRNTQFAV